MTESEFQSDKLTDAQRAAMKALHERSGIAWTEFLENSQPPGLGGYVSVTGFHGMFVGIEPDGYTHT